MIPSVREECSKPTCDRVNAIEGSMQHKILTELVFDPKQLRQAINQGAPLVMIQPNHPLSQSLLELAQMEEALLEPQPEEVPEEVDLSQSEAQRRSGLFGRLRK